MEIKYKIKKIKIKREEGPTRNMRYFKIPLCRIFHWKSEIDLGQMTYERRVQRHVSVTIWVKNWGMTDAPI